ncbi:MAG: PTS lactose/cellobiose transporter subunit IIA [Erysipelotrichaceae bacterium]
MNEAMLQHAMNIIMYAGDARSNIIQALQASRKDQKLEARALMEEAANSLLEAHKIQTLLLQAEMRGEDTSISLLLIHSQDHLMNALLAKDMAEEILIREGV